MEGWPEELTWPAAAAGTEGLRQAPEELATGMGIPDEALVTDTGLPVGNLGQQPRVGTADPGAAAKG